MERTVRVEKSPDAFASFKHNFVDRKSNVQFDWPKWLPVEAMETGTLLKKYKAQLSGLAGKVDLIAGGPPCQGFSSAGKRNPKDPRIDLPTNI